MTWLGMMWHFATKTFASYVNLSFLLVLLLVLFAGIISMQTERVGLQRRYKAMGISNVPVAYINAETAHQTVWTSTTYYFLHSATGKGGGLLPMRFTMQWLAFILPIVALAASFRSVSHEIETGIMQSILVLPRSQQSIGLARLCGESLSFLVTIVVGLGAVGIAAARGIGISWSPDQLFRAILALVLVGVYLALFLVVGSWISAKARRSSQALWIAAGVFLALFITHIGLEGVLTLSSPDYPEVPKSSGVHAYFEQLAFRPELAAQPPDHVIQYLDDLAAYSSETASVLRERYQLERWVNALSPTHLFLEIAGQLLQDEFANASDIIYYSEREQTSPSIAKSLQAAAPEMLWLLLLIATLTFANTRVLSRLEV